MTHRDYTHCPVCGDNLAWWQMYCECGWHRKNANPQHYLWVEEDFELERIKQ